MHVYTLVPGAEQFIPVIALWIDFFVSYIYEYLYYKAMPQKPQYHPATLQALSAKNLMHRPLCTENIEALCKFQQILLLKGYSKSTLKTYKGEFHLLLRIAGMKPVVALSKDQLHSYLLWLLLKKQYKEAQMHSAINAIKFYYEKVLGQPQLVFNMPRPKKQIQLPKVHDESNIEKMIKSTGNCKHRAMLMLAYSTGMRLSEITNVKLTDIDSGRMVIRIVQAKGKKDRQVSLSPVLLQQLRLYYTQYKPMVFLFEGSAGEQYSNRSVQQVFKQAKERAGIKNAGGIHTLRHSYATHLLENGTDIRIIQELLGHTRIDTTLRYTHVSKAQLQKIVSPLDRLNL